MLKDKFCKSIENRQRKNILNTKSSCKTNSSKNEQMGLYQFKNILFSKGNNQQSEGTTYRIKKEFLQLTLKQKTDI